jgi:hypothetical protein
VIWVPQGDPDDTTRSPAQFDPIVPIPDPVPHGRFDSPPTLVEDGVQSTLI